MPLLTIDNMDIEVPRGTKVIDAAEQLGIMIPRFCYHKALGPAVGACRLCAVKFMEGPVKGIQMSCMVEAADGMKVSTTDPEAVDFRRHVIEWLMMNHPHDCPVCDEGGHCLLQDETVSSAHSLRRFPGLKRTYRNQDIGPFLRHEMNRCIHCYRCVRYYQEITGYRDLGAMQLASRVYFGRFEEGPLESPFSGNLIELCPTGVFTDKPSRFRARRWDLQRAETLCIHCSMGCNIIANVRYREVIRIEPRYNSEINGYFICDRGRYGFSYVNHESRPRMAQVDGQNLTTAEALRKTAARISDVAQGEGPSAIAALLSPRSSLETLASLSHLAKSRKWKTVSGIFDPGRRSRIRSAVQHLHSDTAISMQDLKNRDFILVLGADPLNDAPMLVLALRQAWRSGAKIAVMDPRPIFLTFDFDHLPATPGEMRACMGAILDSAFEGEKVADEKGAAFLDSLESSSGNEGAHAEMPHRIDAIAEALKKSQRPAIVCGTDMAAEGTGTLAADTVRFLRSRNQEAALLYLMNYPNAFGQTLLEDSDTLTFEACLEEIEEGRIKALLIAEADPFFHYPDRPRLEKALEKLDLLALFDYLPSGTAEKADHFLPTSTLFESSGSYVNHEGRIQRFHPVYEGGTPMLQINDGDHPPRVYDTDGVPGGDPRPADRLIAELGQVLSGDGEVFSDDPWKNLTADIAPFFKYRHLDAPPENVRILPDESSVFEGNREPQSDGDAEAEGLQIIYTEWIFGTEELAAFSKTLRPAEKEPFVCLHSDDAAPLGIGQNDPVRIDFGGDCVLESRAKLFDRMARGVLVIPRHYRLDWKISGRFGGRARIERLRETPGSPSPLEREEQ